MKELDFIKSFIQTNQKYVLDKFNDRQLLTMTSKGDPSDLLTEVDLTIQKRFVDAVKENFSGDAVVGEEGGMAAIPTDISGRIWVIDPIDGTYNFVRGIMPAFAISIAFVVDGIALAAGAMLPLCGQLFLAESGKGSFCNGKRLVVSSVQRIEEACMDVDFGVLDERRIFVRRGLEVLRKAGQIRCQGSAVVGICQVASGDAEGFLHMTLHPWDYAAAQLIAEEAGAMATRLEGSPLQVFDGKQGVLITNGAIHKNVLSLLSR